MDHEGWWEAQSNNSLSIGLSIYLSLLLSVCLTAWESIRLNAGVPFLAIHLHPRLAACQPDHLPASLSTWWPAYLADWLPAFMSVCLCAAAPTCLCACQCLSDRVPLCGHKDVPWSYIQHRQRLIQSHGGRLCEEKSLTWMDHCLYCMLKNTADLVNWEYLIPLLGWMEIFCTLISMFNRWRKSTNQIFFLLVWYLAVYLISCSWSVHSPPSKEDKMTVMFFN